MEKQELLKQLENEFKEIKKQRGFKSSLEDLDAIFFIKDFILDRGFVSFSLSRQICARIIDTYMSWVVYLHNLIIPAPQNIMHLTESEMFGKEEKEKIMDLIKKAMTLANTNTLAGLNKNKKQEAKFIDDSVEFWKRAFCPEIIKIIEKIRDGWGKK